MKKITSFLFAFLFTGFTYSQTVQTLSMFMDIDAYNNSIYISTLGLGVIKSTNAGDNWYTASLGIEGKDIRSLAISPSDPNELVATVWNNCCPVGGFLAVFKSTNGGDNWIQANSGLSGSLGPIAYDPSNTNVIYVAGYFGAFYKTTNGGTTWASISGIGWDVNSLYVQSDGSVWAGGQGGLIKSTNGGLNWQTISGIPSGNIIKIIGSSTDLNFILVNKENDIFKSTNAGTNWTQVGQNIGSGNILGFGSNLNTFFIGNKKGVYKTSDGGNSWSVVDTNSVLLAHQGSASNNNLYVVSGGGIFSINNVTTNIGEPESIMPIKLSLSQNYPNPFNPSTNIEFKINSPANVKINIYDINGQLICNLVNEELSTGVYTTNWDGTDSHGNKISSGTYFYRVEAGSTFDVKKMILLK